FLTFSAPARTATYTLSLHDALPICFVRWSSRSALVPEQAQERKLRHGLLIQGPLPQKLDHKGEHDREESPQERAQGDVEHEPPCDRPIGHQRRVDDAHEVELAAGFEPCGLVLLPGQ